MAEIRGPDLPIAVGAPTHVLVQDQTGSAPTRMPTATFVSAIAPAAATYVFVFAGQSNALGQGTGGDTSVNTNVFAWDYQDEIWRVAALGNRPFNNSGANNAALQAARFYQAKHGGNVYLIGYAVGATSITTWKAGGVNYDTPAVPGDPCLKDIVDAAFASAELVAAGKTDVDGFLWDQGEIDDTMTYATYLGHLDALILTYRSASWGGGSNTPFVAAEMLPIPSTGKHIVSYRMKVQRGDDLYFALVSNSGMDAAGVGDNTHKTGADLTTQGFRYEAALDDMPRAYVPVRTSWLKPWFKASLHASVSNVTGDNTTYQLICQNEGTNDEDDPYGIHSGGVSGTGKMTVPSGAWGRWRIEAKISLVLPASPVTIVRYAITLVTSNGSSRFWVGPRGGGDDNNWLSLPTVFDTFRLTNLNDCYVTVAVLCSTSALNTSILGASTNSPTWWRAEKLDD